MLSCTLGGTSNTKKDITIFTINYLILPHDIWLLLLSIIYRMQNKGEKNTKRQPKEIDENERLLHSKPTSNQATDHYPLFPSSSSAISPIDPSHHLPVICLSCPSPSFPPSHLIHPDKAKTYNNHLLARSLLPSPMDMLKEKKTTD